VAWGILLYKSSGHGLTAMIIGVVVIKLVDSTCIMVYGSTVWFYRSCDAYIHAHAHIA
jgi:hypothetical protein